MRLPAFALAVLTALVFLPCCFHEFVDWDDRALIFANPDVLGFNVGAMFDGRSYQGVFPLTLMTWAVDWRIAGGSQQLFATWVHGGNLVLHILNTLLSLRLAFLLLPGRAWAAIVATAFFALHPMHVETVAWATERKGLLCALFYLAALTSYIDNKGSKPLVWTLFGMLACLAKSAGFTLPLVLIAYEMCRGNKPPGRLLPLFAAGAATLASELISQRVDEVAAHAKWSLLTGLDSAARAAMFYGERLVLPHRLSAFYRYDDVAPTGLTSAGCAAAIGIWVLAWRKEREHRRMLIFAVVAGAIIMGPTLKLVPFGSSFVNDRYTYLAAIALFLPAALLFERGFRHVRLSPWTATTALSVVLAIPTTARVAAWRNGASLWRATIASYPLQARAHLNLGLHYLGRGSAIFAMAPLERAVDIEPRYDVALFNFGAALAELGRFEEALEAYARYAEIRPNDPDVYGNGAKILDLLGRKDAADEMRRIAASLAPGRG